MAASATTKIDRQDRRWWLSGKPAHVPAIGFWLCSLLLLRQPLASLASLALHDERSSHILLIPLISGCLLYLQRRRIFRNAGWSPTAGLPLLGLPLVLWFSLKSEIASLDATGRLSAIVLLIVLTWIAGFILFYGFSSFQIARFPLLFLLLMVPLPVAWGDFLVHFLQRGSAEACYVLFRLLQVPVIRHGFQFSLPGVDIEVAQQCSGIHSALSLFIVGLLAGQLLLRGSVRKLGFFLCILPIAILKNAIRIVTISWLGIHVNPAFFSGELHRQGGLPFSFIALALMGLLLWILRWTPATRGEGTGSSSEKLLNLELDHAK